MIIDLAQWFVSYWFYGIVVSGAIYGFILIMNPRVWGLNKATK